MTSEEHNNLIKYIFWIKYVSNCVQYYPVNSRLINWLFTVHPNNSIGVFNQIQKELERNYFESHIKNTFPDFYHNLEDTSNFDYIEYNKPRPKEMYL